MLGVVLEFCLTDRGLPLGCHMQSNESWRGRDSLTDTERREQRPWVKARTSWSVPGCGTHMWPFYPDTIPVSGQS